MNSSRSNLLVGFMSIFLMLFCMCPLHAEDANSQKNKISSVTLCGVILSNDTTNSLVVLKDESDGTIHFFAEGDRYRDYTIVHIYENRIVLQKNDVLYQLFSKKKGSEHLKPLPKKEPMKALPSNNKEKAVKKEFYRNDVEKRIEAERQILIKGTEIVPNWQEGKINGLKIIRLPGGSILSELGIHENDVLININGSELYDSYTLIAQFYNYRDVNDFQITLLRKQKIIVIECVLKTPR